MEKNNRSSLAQRLLSAADLPAELAPGTPKLTVIGCSEVTIEGHRGLVEYTGERITSNCGKYLVTVKGSGLTISAMDREDMLISGVIFSVEYVY